MSQYGRMAVTYIREGSESRLPFHVFRCLLIVRRRTALLRCDCNAPYGSPHAAKSWESRWQGQSRLPWVYTSFALELS